MQEDIYFFINIDNKKILNKIYSNSSYGCLVLTGHLLCISIGVRGICFQNSKKWLYVPGVHTLETWANLRLVGYGE